VEPLLANVRAKTSELYGFLEPTVGPYVKTAGDAIGRLAANGRTLAAEAGEKLRTLSKEVPVGGGTTLHDVLFGDQEAQVRMMVSCKQCCGSGFARQCRGSEPT